jgi:protein TonB
LAVLAGHASLALLLAERSVTPPPRAEAALAIMLDLAAPADAIDGAQPSVAAPPDTAIPKPPAEPIAQPEPAEDAAVVPSVERQMDAPPPQAVADAAVPPPPLVKPKPPARRAAPPASERTAQPASKPNALAAAPTARAAPNAPAMGANPPPTGRVTGHDDWRGLLLRHLERHKAYPPTARMRRQQGVAQVRFTVDRHGVVLSARLEQGTGHASLDAEATALPRRASPLPRPPDDVAGERIELIVPIMFTVE